MSAKYDDIGQTYAQRRQPDARIAAQIRAALGDARSVVNVGAGTGSYEPPDLEVTAVEPSARMIAQRPATAAPAIQASAESLPFATASFDAAMASLTLHHWTDVRKGLAELRRVARKRVVILTYDPRFRDFWLLDYFPGLATLDDSQMPQIDWLCATLGSATVGPVPIPHDCQDGFLAAYWRRPEMYLDPAVRAGMSSFWALGDISNDIARLETDLNNGQWQARYGDLLAQESRDCGYRLITAE